MSVRNAVLSGLIATLMSGQPASGETPASRDEWIGVVQGLLLENLEMPDPRLLDRDFMVRLNLTVQRDGTVRNVRIERSSGRKELDQVALDMVARTGKLPEFASDMNETQIDITMPVQIMTIKPSEPQKGKPSEPSGLRYHDPDTGFGVRVEFPFQLGKPHNDARFDRLVDISNLLNSPPMDGTSKRLCSAGFKATPGNRHLPQKAINAPAEIQVKIDAMRMMQAAAHARIEETHVFSQGGAKGVEFVIAPGIGPNHDAVRQYVAIWDRPQGRLTSAVAR